MLILNIAVASRVGAVTDEEVQAGLRFRPPAPGARLAAMGGAGLALVDDAAAARVNPARLCAINTPEIVIEGQSRSTSEISTQSGNIRFDASINPFAGTRFGSGESVGSTMTPAFLAYAHPMKLWSRPLVVAFSRSQVLDV